MNAGGKSDYEALDITPLCEEAISGLAESIQTGPRVIRGLPFRIGARSSCGGSVKFLVLDAESGIVDVPIGRKAHSVIVAHRLLSDPIEDDGGGVGDVACYEFRFGDEVESVPIRERHEIAHVGKSQLSISGDNIPYSMYQPFGAVSDVSPGVGAGRLSVSDAYEALLI